jgi:DNA polymerase III subunit delta'
MSWNDVIGQQRVRDILLSAWRQERMPHAYLFHGSEGVGKDAVALELARMVCCEQGGEDSCGECPSCIRLKTLSHPDVRFIMALPRGAGEQSGDDPMGGLTGPEVKAVQEELQKKAANAYHTIALPRANAIKINSIREMRRLAALSKNDGGWRVFIISEADGMEAEASNTLLKTLEEPPPRTLIVLTTSHPDQLLPTIHSRCQKVRFDPLTDEDIEAALKERFGVEASSAPLAARLGNGSVTRALDFADGDLGKVRGEMIEFLRLVVTHRVAPMIDAIKDLSEEKDRDRVIRFLRLMLMWFRDVLAHKHHRPVINADEEATLAKLVRNLPLADVPGAMQAVEDAISLVDRYAYIPLTLLQLSVRLRRSLVEGQTIT